MPAADDLVVKNGLRLFSPSAALVKVPESFFADSRSRRRSRWGVSRCVGPAAAPSHRREFVKAGYRRRAPADRPAGSPTKSSRAMKAAGYDVRESDPFEPARRSHRSLAAPIVVRIQAMWKSMRDSSGEFPGAARPPGDRTLICSSRISTRATPITPCRSKGTA